MFLHLEIAPRHKPVFCVLYFTISDDKDKFEDAKGVIRG